MGVSSSRIPRDLVALFTTSRRRMFETTLCAPEEGRGQWDTPPAHTCTAPVFGSCISATCTRSLPPSLVPSRAPLARTFHSACTYESSGFEIHRAVFANQFLFTQFWKEGTTHRTSVDMSMNAESDCIDTCGVDSGLDASQRRE